MKAALFSVITIVSIASAPSLARDQIHIVSTPSDFRFTTMVGEYFARSYHQPVPLVERRSASTAVKYFCAGVGRQHPDVVGLARPLQVRELDRCQESGVKRVTEIKFGYDGVFEQISRTYDDALRDVASSRRVTAILPYTVFEQNAHRIAAHPIEGVVPDEVTIAMNSYPVTCPLYLYVKLAHYDRVPGILEFVAEYTSDRAWGPEGYLTDSGLVPLSHRDRIDQRANAIGLNPILR